MRLLIALEALLRETVAPDRWKEPNAYLKALPGRVVVRHKPEVVR